jgi:hypothetical protein
VLFINADEASVGGGDREEKSQLREQILATPARLSPVDPPRKAEGK